MFFALTACAGSGYKNYSDLSSNLEPSESTKVFILRDMGYQGSLALVHIKLNRALKFKNYFNYLTPQFQL